MKKWLITCGEEGMTGFDALCMSVGVVVAFGVMILFAYFKG